MKTKIALFVMGTLSALGSSQAEAINYVHMKQHGSGCLPQQGAEGQVSYHPQYGVQNNDASRAATVMCEVSPLGGTAYVRTDVVVYDRHPSAAVTCTMRLVNADGGLRWSQTRSSDSSGASAKYLTFSGMPSGGWLSLECSLPPSSGGQVSHVASVSFMYGI